MTLHHLHMSMLDHGLGMAAEGSNLLMLSEMGMAADFNPTTRAHGQAMLKRGKDLIERALSGEEMKGLHEKEGTEGATMRQTHELGEAMKAVVSVLEDMRPTEAKPGKEMTLHQTHMHMHIALNHALAMAAGRSHHAGRDGHGPQGRYRLGRARQGHARGCAATLGRGDEREGHAGDDWRPEPSKGMTQTHELAEAGKKVIDLLEKMHAP